MNTAKNTVISAATCVAPKIINKSLSGKYTKLNTVQKYIKKFTSSPYQGKYTSGPNYLADSLYYSYKRAKNRVISNAAELGFKKSIEYLQ